MSLTYSCCTHLLQAARQTCTRQKSSGLPVKKKPLLLRAEEQGSIQHVRLSFLRAAQMLRCRCWLICGARLCCLVCRARGYAVVAGAIQQTCTLSFLLGRCMLGMPAG